MSTIVFVHAHPDDEASATAGSMARAADEGHRVILVIATNGDHGEAPPDLASGQTPPTTIERGTSAEESALIDAVIERRRLEAETSGKALGVSRIAWLGYADSGMTGWAQNSAPGALMGADVDEAAARLVAVLDEEQADVVVGYDWHGNYGHPDHIAVHRLVRRAVELARRRPRLLEVTMNRDAMRAVYLAAKAAGIGDFGGDGEDFDPDAPADDGNPIGTPEAEIQLRVDVLDRLDRKRASLQAHASQTTDVGMMLSLPQEVFVAMFRYEHYLEPAGDTPSSPMRTGWIFD